MAISKVLVDTKIDSGAGGNLTVTLPGSLLSTDIVILAVGIGQSAAAAGSYDTPTGWTKVGEVINAANGNNHVTGQVYVAVGSPSGLTFTLTGNASTKGSVCAAFRGVDNVNPIDATGTANSNTGATSITANAVTVVTDQAWHVICAFDWQGGVFTATNFTVSQNASSNESAAVLYNTTPKGTGSTGTVSVACGGAASGQVIIAVPFALRPDAGGGGASTAPVVPAGDVDGIIGIWDQLGVLGG